MTRTKTETPIHKSKGATPSGSGSSNASSSSKGSKFGMKDSQSKPIQKTDFSMKVVKIVKTPITGSNGFPGIRTDTTYEDDFGRKIETNQNIW